MENPQADNHNIQYEYIIRTEEYIPIEVVRHLLRVQGQTNRLAAEQDLQIIDLEAEVDRLRGEVTCIQRQMEKEPLLGIESTTCFAIIGLALAIFISVFRVAWFEPQG